MPNKFTLAMQSHELYSLLTTKQRVHLTYNLANAFMQNPHLLEDFKKVFEQIAHEVLFSLD